MTNVNHVAGVSIIIKKNTKIAQMTMNPHSTHLYSEQVDKVENDTTRVEGSFGSQGDN